MYKNPWNQGFLGNKILEIKDFKAGILSSLEHFLEILEIKDFKEKRRFFLFIEEYYFVFFPPTPDNVKTVTQPKN